MTVEQLSLPGAATLHPAQQALQGSEDRFRRVVDAVPNALLTVNADGLIDMANAQAERAFGRSRSELVGQPVDMLLPELYRTQHPALRAAFGAAPQAGLIGMERDLYAVREDGSEFPVEIRLSPVGGGDGPMVLVSIIDITERKRAEQILRDAQRRSDEALARLQQSEEQLKHAQRLAQIGSDIRDLQTDETDWSDETYRIFGVERGSFVPSTKNVMTMIHPDDRAQVDAIRDQIVQGSCPPTFEFRIVRPDGAMRDLYRENELVRDATGRPTFLVATVQDVTDRRRTEAQLLQAQKMEAIGGLTGGMAHDFNNLLGIIIGNLGLACDEVAEGDEDLREMIGEALEAGWRGADLTRRLLAFAGRQPLRPARVELNDLLSNAVRLLRRLLGEQIEVRLDLGGDVWPIVADPAQLEAALTNLATNARDAMPKGGQLILATANRVLDADYVAGHPDATVGDYAMIEVSDTGTGMPAEIIGRIFEPFFTTKEAGKGTGLGLSMVFGFLRQSGGHVSVSSEKAKGTTFRLYLPRDASGPQERDARAARRIAGGGGEIVLVVEDNQGMRRVALRQLRGLGYRVVECERAGEALEILQRDPVDLLLTDIIMPGGLDGVELARIAAERWPALKIVLTSGFPQARMELAGNELRGVELLNKPYSREEMATVLHKALHG